MNEIIRFIRGFILLAVTSALAGCASVLTLPAAYQGGEGEPSIVWVPATSDSQPAVLLLQKEGARLADAESLFDEQTVETLGQPAADRLKILISPTGNTRLAHENASESSPAEQIVVFSKDKTDRWQARRLWPPHQKGPLYGQFATSCGVDDEFLFYQFSDGVLRRSRIDSLAARK